MKHNWRSPNTCEAEFITAWTRKVLRDQRLLLYILFAVFGSIPVGGVIMALTGIMEIIDVMKYEIIWILFFLIPGILVGRGDIRKKKQLLNADYQIIDSEVVGGCQDPTGYINSYYVMADTHSEEIMEIKVSKTIYKVIQMNMPGFILRYKEDDCDEPGPSDKPEKRSTIFKSAAQRRWYYYEFFPAIRAEG